MIYVTILFILMVAVFLTKESLIDSVIHADGIFFSPGRVPETAK